MLTRAEILAGKCETKEIDVPEWGGRIIIRQLNVRERAELFDRQNDSNVARIQSEIAVVIAAVLDENGAQIFKTEDAPQLLAKVFDPKPIEKIALEVLKFSGIIEPGESEKNSETAQIASFSSSLP